MASFSRKIIKNEYTFFDFANLIKKNHKMLEICIFFALFIIHNFFLYLRTSNKNKWRIQI